MKNVLRSPIFWGLIVTALVIGGIQLFLVPGETPGEEATTTETAPEVSPEAAAPEAVVQDSLLALIDPGTFEAQVTGRASAGAVAEEGLGGGVAFARETADDGSRLRFELRDPILGVMDVMVYRAATLDADVGLRTYAHGDDRPYVRAELRQGERVRTSQGGTLTLSRAPSGGVLGRFVFEMAPVGEGDAYTLAGVFKTRPSAEEE